MNITNERIKSFLKDPTLYKTTVVVGSKSYEYFSWSDGDDIQTAEDVSMLCLHREHGITDAEADEVTTQAV